MNDDGGRVAERTRRDAGRDAVDASSGGSRYVGRWLVEQPYRAGHEATVYELRGDGALREVCSLSHGGRVPVGWVDRDDERVQCVMVGPWASSEPSELAIGAACDDDMSRTVRLQVNWDGEVAGRVSVRDVDGDRAWSHRWPHWRWIRCGRDPALCDVVCP